MKFKLSEWYAPTNWIKWPTVVSETSLYSRAVILQWYSKQMPAWLAQFHLKYNFALGIFPEHISKMDYYPVIHQLINEPSMIGKNFEN